MSESTGKRIDEVDKYYKPIKRWESVILYLFWIIAIFSLLMPYVGLMGCTLKKVVFQPLFIVLVLSHFALSQILRIYLIPKAEKMRLKQFLSNAFGTHLSHDKTQLYYNNEFSPSIQRLGANTLENALFSKTISLEMLKTRRGLIIGYLIIWLFAVLVRHSDVSVLTWLTQLIFSGQIVAQWLNLEVLRCKCERIYEELHTHFLHKIGHESPEAVASVLNAFVSYESAKASAGLRLSTKVFNRLNPSLSQKWEQIRKELQMDV